MYKKFVVALLLVAFVLPLSVSAQLDYDDSDEDALPEGAQLEELTAEDFLNEYPEGAVSCFDYYAFGSVEALLTTQTANTVPGVPVSFSGELKNNNPYPVVDGTLFVKILRTRTTEKDIFGPDVVDQFRVLSGVSIPAGGSVPVQFSWQVPEWAQGGEYVMATFFTTSDKFNLLGLPFTDDVLGNTVSFGVTSDVATGVQFDKEGITVNGEEYASATFPPYTTATDPVPVVASIVNTTDAEQTATVSWKIYKWDAQLEADLVDQKTERITVPAGGSAPVSITVTDTDYSIYVALGTLTWNGTKSVIAARFVRPDINRIRLNFPSVVFFPLVAGQENRVFSCMHNAGTDQIVPGSKLELTLADTAGNVIHEFSYEGAVTDAMMAAVDSFIPTKTYTSFNLIAKLYQNGELVDDVTLTYDCSEIDPATCAVASAEAEQLSANNDVAASVLTAVALAVVLLMLIGLVVMVLMRRRVKDDAYTVGSLNEKE